MGKKQSTEHSMISNIVYFVRLLFNISPAFVIGEFVNGILMQLPLRLISVIGVKYIVDVVISGERMNRIFYAVTIIAAVLISSRLLSNMFIQLYWNIGREKIHKGLNSTLYEKAKELDLEYYDNPEFYNDFILTIESSSENIQRLLRLVRAYVGDLVSLITISAVILTIDPVCLVIVVASVLIFLPLSKRIGSLQMERRVENTKYHRRSDYFQRIFYLQDYAKEVRMNSINPMLMDRYNDAADDVVKNQIKYQSKISLLYFIQETGVQTLGFMFLLPLYLGYCIMVKKSLTAGDFLATFNGAYGIAMSINFLTIQAVAIFSERGKMIEKYREFLNSESKIKDGQCKSTSAEDDLKPQEIEIKNMGFTYPGNDHPTLNGINLTIKPYEKIALVGYNGAGKTTLTNLLLRLYDVTQGEIKIGGKNIKDVPVEEHRNRFAAVFQDFQLFAASLAENVSLDPEYDGERVKEALAHGGFTKQLPNGINTELLREFDSEGVMLSGGEAQKVAVSRAFYKKCPYIIMDEPSANLDPIAEYRLNRAMMEAAEDKTVIFISHRLSTTRSADRIVVIENGSIVESGTHEELMASGGKYAYMFNLQAEKYTKEIENQE